MIRKRILAAALLLLAPLPAAAQSAQDDLDARYDRALAAGYKALFLCSAIANAERNGVTRTPESVAEWELAGVYSAVDSIIPELPYELVYSEGRFRWLTQVAVDWTDDMPPRVATVHYREGCSLLPIGAEAPAAEPTMAMIPPSAPPAFIPVGNDQSLVVASDKAFAAGYGADARTTAVFVQEGGRPVLERYADGFGPATPQRTWSVAKSIAATLVGAAVQRGDASVDDPAIIFAWQAEGDPRQAILLDHLLRMASGRYSDTVGSRTDPLYIGGSSVAETATGWPLAYRPGTTFRYANNDTLMAVMAIDHTFKDHPPAELLSALGMYHSVAETDWQGNYILSSQVWSTARDLAKLGQLYLNDGALPDGTRILPEGWVDYVSRPSGPQPGGPLGYGAGFWLFNKSGGIPPDTFAAMGNRGQYVVIVPSRDIVIVRRGEDPEGGSGFDILSFTRDVLAALE